VIFSALIFELKIGVVLYGGISGTFVFGLKMGVGKEKLKKK
jgi:hypothetical protein